MPSISQGLPLLLLLLFSIPFAQARECFIDNRGNTVCNGLTVGARIGIALGLFALAMVLLVSLGAMRRRRVQRANLAYVTNQQQGPGAYDPYAYQQGGQVPPQNYPPYPPQAHVDPAPQYGQPPAGYDTQQYGYPSYAPPPGPPPKQ